MFSTVIHPHEVSKWAKLTAVVIDQSQVRTRYVPGTEDVEELEKRTKFDRASLPEIGLVPAAHQSELLVVFNGGFKPRHGRWGMMVAGLELLAPREG
jgi:hypothetical protein